MRSTLLALLLVVGCRDKPAGVPSAGSPQRIISLAPSITEILFKLGVGDRVVGTTRFCDWPPEAAGIAKIGGYVDPSVEAVAGLRPDLVLAVPSPANQRPVKAMIKLGLRVEVIRDGRLSDVRGAILHIGTLVGAADAGALVVGGLDSQLAKIAAANAGRPKPKTLLVYGHRPLVVAGASSYAGELLALAGGENIVRSEVGYPLWSVEKVLADGPQVIIDVAMDPGDPPADAREGDGIWGRWPSLPAVRDGRVHRVDAGALMRPGPRAPEAAATLARLIHSPPQPRKAP